MQVIEFVCIFRSVKLEWVLFSLETVLRYMVMYGLEACTENTSNPTIA